MIINLRFGRTNRHHIYYDTERKRGTLKLWSSYSGPITGANSENQEDVPSESNTHQDLLTETLFRENQRTEFSITDEQDILSMLAALDSVLNANESSFLTKEGRKVTLFLKKEGKSKKDAITVKIQYGKDAKLTMGEAHKLHTIAMNILRNLGYSDQEISEKRESVTQTA
jgi:hypothetical protein